MIREEGKKISTLGADVEFVRLNAKGAIDQPLNRDIISLFGTDGTTNGHTGRPDALEIRTVPAYSPQELLDSTQFSLEWGYKKHEILREGIWVSSTEKHPLGMHLHCLCTPEGELIDMLDKVLANFFVLFEHPEAAIKRRTGNFDGHPYGNYGDIRDDNKGRSAEMVHPGFEYRVLGSTLHSKLLTYGTYILFAAIIDAYSNHNIKKVPTTIRKNNTAFQNCDKSVFIKMLPDIWSFVKSLPYFEKHYIGAKYYGHIFNLFQTALKKEFPDPNTRDIKVVWGLEEKQVRKDLKTAEVKIVKVQSKAGLKPATTTGGF